MKIIFLILFFVSPITLMAQDVVFPVDSATKKINYSEVISVNGKKSALFAKALDWFALTFKSSNDVIQIKDLDSGKIIGKWSIFPFDAASGYVSCNIIMLVKDDKYKYSVTDLYYQGTSQYPGWSLEDDPGSFKVNMTKGSQRKLKRRTDEIVKNVIVTLKEAMNKSTKTEDF